MPVEYRLKTKVAAMLAEIFMLRLETAAQTARQKEGPPKERFVPFSPNSQFTFKDRPVPRPRYAGALVRN